MHIFDPQPYHFRGSFCHLLWKIVRPPCSEGFLFKGVANFLTTGGKKTPCLSPPMEGLWEPIKDFCPVSCDTIECSWRCTRDEVPNLNQRRRGDGSFFFVSLARHWGKRENCEGWLIACCLVGCLVACLVGWLAGRLAGWLGCLVALSLGWVACLAACLVAWSGKEPHFWV